MLIPLAPAALVLMMTVCSAEASEPKKYDPTASVTAEEVASLVEFNEAVLKLQAIKLQIDLGIGGNVAEECMARLLAHYSHPGSDTAWPFGMNWRDEKGWENSGAFIEQMNLRTKFDETHMTLCVKGSAK